MHKIKTRFYLPGSATIEEKKWINTRLEELGHAVYISTAHRPSNDFNTDEAWGFGIQDGVYTWMKIGSKHERVEKPFSWWKENIENSTKEDNIQKKQVYWLLQSETTLDSRILIHELMDKHGADMGSYHSDRVTADGKKFNWNFSYDSSTNKYYAFSDRDVPEFDNVNKKRTPEWFKSFILNDFEEPERIVDNSDSTKESFLDKQLQAINI